MVYLNVPALIALHKSLDQFIDLATPNTAP